MPRFPEDRIAIATGDRRGLDRIDLFDPACPIEHVVTVEALKEGWDCSFAYAFCSVSRIQSAVDVEQLLGRVLRMPYAKRRKADALNRAYAFLSEPSFGEAARALVDKLAEFVTDSPFRVVVLVNDADFVGIPGGATPMATIGRDSEGVNSALLYFMGSSRC